eukprot:1588969-Pyramimonas_sp.AAC.1
MEEEDKASRSEVDDVEEEVVDKPKKSFWNSVLRSKAPEEEPEDEAKLHATDAEEAEEEEEEVEASPKIGLGGITIPPRKQGSTKASKLLTKDLEEDEEEPEPLPTNRKMLNPPRRAAVKAASKLSASTRAKPNNPPVREVEEDEDHDATHEPLPTDIPADDSLEAIGDFEEDLDTKSAKPAPRTKLPVARATKRPATLQPTKYAEKTTPLDDDNDEESAIRAAASSRSKLIPRRITPSADALLQDDAPASAALSPRPLSKREAIHARVRAAGTRRS